VVESTRCATYWCRCAVALSDWIGARVVSCETEKKDRYKRWLARCSAGGQDLGQWLAAKLRRAIASNNGTLPCSTVLYAGLWIDQLRAAKPATPPAGFPPPRFSAAGIDSGVVSWSGELDTGTVGRASGNKQSLLPPRKRLPPCCSGYARSILSGRRRQNH
jgi:hypothetical protein